MNREDGQWDSAAFLSSGPSQFVNLLRACFQNACDFTQRQDFIPIVSNRCVHAFVDVGLDVRLCVGLIGHLSSLSFNAFRFASASSMSRMPPTPAVWTGLT